MLEGRLTWPGLTSGVLSFSYTCTHGSGPGVATAVVPLDALAGLAAEGDLTFGDGVHGDIVLRRCRLDSVNLVEAAGGRAAAVHFADRRWAWRFGGVSGWYNQRDPFPDPRPEADPKFQLAALQNTDPKLWGQLDFDQFLARPGEGEFVPGTERTPKQLMLLCLAAMFEPGGGIDFGPVPDDARPPADWAYTNPAQALQSVADAVGCRLIFQPCRDGVLIGPPATPADRFALPDLPTVSDSPGLNPPDPPDAIVCAGGPILVSDFWRLQAVGLEADGSVRPIEQLSYRPADGWWSGIPGWDHWNRVVQGDSPDVDTSKALAKQFVWRTFRLVGAPVDQPRREPPEPPAGGSGADWDAAMRQYLAEKAEFEQQVPIPDFPPLTHPRQIELLDVEYDIDRDARGQLKSKPAKLWADSYKLFGDARLKGYNREHPAELDVSFSMDGRGLITTDQPVYKVVLDPTTKKWAGVAPANVYIRCSAKLRHPATFQTLSGQWELRSGSARPNVPPEVIRHPELQPVYVNTRQARRRFRLVLSENNLADLRAAAAYYLRAHADKYRATATTTRVYAGLHPLDPDRAVHQVSWSFGVGRPPTTTVSVGTEHNPYVPSYPERRRVDALAAFVTDNWVNQVLGRWQDGSNK